MGSNQVVATEAEKLGCWLFVFPRDDPENYRNHYVAKRLITSEGYHASKAPNGWLAETLGLSGLARGLGTIGEGMFFLGQLYKTWITVKDELELDPTKHRVKITAADGYRFPKKLFDRPAFKGLINGYTMIAITPLAIWDDPITFSFTAGLTAAVVLFVYFLYRTVDRYLR
jgi:hypothetical protein